MRPYEAVALKDVVWLNTNEEVNVIARFAPWDGLYMVSEFFPFRSISVSMLLDFRISRNSHIVLL